jgi:O-antigen polymerase
MIIGVIATLQVFTSGGKVLWLFETGYRDRVLGPFESPNQYAAFVELLLPLAMAEALRDKPKRLLFLGGTAIMFASVVASASRAGVLLVTIELVLFVCLAHRRRMLPGRSMLRATAMLATLVVAFTAVVGWGSIRQRFRLADPYNIRRELLTSSIDMARTRPWTGFGLGNWATVYPAHAVIDTGAVANHAHNDWAEWAGEGGLPFLALLLSVAVWSAWKTWQIPGAMGIPCVFLHCLVDYPMQEPALSTLVFVLLGGLAATRLSDGHRRASACSSGQVRNIRAAAPSVQMP